MPRLVTAPLFPSRVLGESAPRAAHRMARMRGAQRGGPATQGADCASWAAGGPGAPRSQGHYCYTTQAACAQGANLCSEAECGVQDTLCNTGAASTDSNHRYMCIKDMPLGSLPAGSGVLCYTDGRSCANGPNVRPLRAPRAAAQGNQQRPSSAGGNMHACMHECRTEDTALRAEPVDGRSTRLMMRGNYGRMLK